MSRKHLSRRPGCNSLTIVTAQITALPSHVAWLMGLRTDQRSSSVIFRRSNANYAVEHSNSAVDTKS